MSGCQVFASSPISVGCRARIRTWAKGSKVLCATTTQPGTILCFGAEGRIRTDTGVAPQQFLRLPRLPFRHFGALTLEALILFKDSQWPPPLQGGLLPLT
jgi:hypothetical protein